jgi:Mg-chelatase subunit ChlD
MDVPDQGRLHRAIAQIGQALGGDIERLREAGRIKIDNVAYLLLDCSGSMSEGSKFEQAVRGAAGFAREASAKGYRVGIIRFNSSASMVASPGAGPQDLEEVLGSLTVEGSTRLDTALELATRLLAEEKGLRAIVVVTDGQPDDPALARRAAERAKEAGIDILAIGTDDADWDFLRAIVTRPDLAAYVPRGRLAQGIRQAAGLLPGGG